MKMIFFQTGTSSIPHYRFQGTTRGAKILFQDSVYQDSKNKGCSQVIARVDDVMQSKIEHTGCISENIKINKKIGCLRIVYIIEPAHMKLCKDNILGYIDLSTQAVTTLNQMNQEFPHLLLNKN